MNWVVRISKSAGFDIESSMLVVESVVFAWIFKVDDADRSTSSDQTKEKDHPGRRDFIDHGHQ
jgi:hypothetical protein